MRYFSYNLTTYIISLIIIFLFPLEVSGLMPTKEKTEYPIQRIKLEKKRKREQLPDSRRRISNKIFYLSYTVKNWNAKKVALHVYLMRKRRGKKTTYKKTIILEGKSIEKGSQQVELEKEYEDGAYTKNKHGKIKKIRVEVWYPAYGGKLIQAIEEPSPNKRSFRNFFKKNKSKKKELSWWEKIEYGNYF